MASRESTEKRSIRFNLTIVYRKKKSPGGNKEKKGKKKKNITRKFRQNSGQ